ncbi:MAG: response regulator [Desulfomonilaceae bacterium]
MDGQILEGKRILVVDHEREVLNIVAEALVASEVVIVGNAEEARPLIAKEFFNPAILDTVSASGCDLLQDCQANKLPAAMLTSREVEVRRVNEAMKWGAMSFFPKDELDRLPETIAELLERLEKGKTHWTKPFRRLGAAFRKTWLVVMEEIDQHPRKFPSKYYW